MLEKWILIWKGFDGDGFLTCDSGILTKLLTLDFVIRSITFITITKIKILIYYYHNNMHLDLVLLRETH